MAAQALSLPAAQQGIKIIPIGAFPKMRALAWDGDLLYTSRGYSLLSARMNGGEITWANAGHYRPKWWRELSSQHALGFRLARDGFHALAITAEGSLVA